MTDTLLSIITISLGVLTLVGALFLPRIRHYNFRQLGAITRNRLVGGVMTLTVMLWVGEHVRVLFFTDWDPTSFVILWLILAGVCIVFVDFLLARALAGLMIMWAYAFANYTFAFCPEPNICVKTVVFLNFIVGVAGVLFAAKPYWLRDFLMYLAHPEHALKRMVFSVVLLVYGLLMIVGGFCL